MTDDDGFLNDFHEAAEFASDYLSERGVEVSVVFDDHMYDPETDIVFLVVDRDQGKERPAESYLGFLAGCYDSGFRPVVTNPRFELWELMHMDDVERDLMEISESRNPSSALKKIMKRRSMDKDDPDYDYLVDHLDNAMRNSVPYVLNPDKLESEVGTNMPDIIGVLKGADTRS